MKPRIIWLAILALILLTSGCFQEKAPPTQEKEQSPEDVFLEYAGSIDAGDYDRALSMSVLETGSGFRTMNEHEKLEKKLSLSEAYGERGERFKILRIQITGREELKDRVRLHYRMSYLLDDVEGEITETIDLVSINGTWRVVLP